MAGSPSTPGKVAGRKAGISWLPGKRPVMSRALSPSSRAKAATYTRPATLPAAVDLGGDAGKIGGVGGEAAQRAGYSDDADPGGLQLGDDTSPHRPVRER